MAAFQTSLQYNPQSSEVSKKIKRISQLARDKKRAQEVENKKSNIDMAKHLEKLKSEMVSVVFQAYCCCCCCCLFVCLFVW
jgi:phage host-nuclease inhibitor protein Gam